MRYSMHDQELDRAMRRAEEAHLDPPEPDENDSDICDHPGRYGCGRCEGCEVWAEREAAAREDRMADEWY